MNKKIWIAILAAVLLIAGGCSKSESTKSAEGQTDKSDKKENEGKKEKVEIKQVLDWFPQPTHGGLYVAKDQKFYEKKNLDVTIEPGGPQVSAVQMVSSGQADFGLASADSILLAREQGVPIVGVAAFLQTSPSALFYHKGENIKSFEDLNGREVYAFLPAPYWKYLKHAYKLDKVKEIQFNGQYGNFIKNKASVSQGYTTNTPAYLKKENVEVDHLLVSESGYDPYYSIVFTTEKYLKEHPEVVKDYLAATIEGWDYYKDNLDSGSKVLKDVNKETTVEELKAEGELQKPFIYEGDAKEHGVGYMTLERWETLSKQLHEIGELKKKEDVKAAFTTEYLPAK